MGRERALVFEKALKPDTKTAGRGAKVRVHGQGSKLHVEIESGSLSHARAALAAHASLIRCLGQIMDNTTDNLLRTQ